MSPGDFCDMLDELLVSPKASKSPITRTEGNLSFKSVMKLGFANFGWTFSLEKINAVDFVKEFLSSLDWRNSKLFSQKEHKVDIPTQEEGERLKQQRNEDLPSDIPSSDPALPILLEMEREAKISSVPSEVPPDAIEKSRLASGSSTKEAQRRKELEAIDAATKAESVQLSSNVKKPRRFI